MSLIRTVLLAIIALVFTACTQFTTTGLLPRLPEADLIAARELARTGQTAKAESVLLAGRSAYAKHLSGWRTYTLALGDLWLEAGKRDKACAYRHEARGGGEVVAIGNDLKTFVRYASGPRQAALAEALAADVSGDHADAVQRFADLRDRLDPNCEPYLRVTTAAMAAALRAGRINDFLALGADLDRYFGDTRVVLPGEESSPAFAIYATYRAIAGKPPVYNTPDAIADRLAFFAALQEDK